MFDQNGLQRWRMARDMQGEGLKIPFSKKFSKLAFQIGAESPRCPLTNGGAEGLQGQRPEWLLNVLGNDEGHSTESTFI